jgi:hypothetical protein
MSLLTEPKHLTRAKVLAQLPKITSAHMTTLLRLEEPFILKELVEHLDPNRDRCGYRRTALSIGAKGWPESRPQCRRWSTPESCG